MITFKGYTEALHEYKINTLGSTGLIFQGSVNDIISRSPSELTKLFENISGSYQSLSYTLTKLILLSYYYSVITKLSVVTEMNGWFRILYEKPYNYMRDKIAKMRMEYKNLLLKKKNLNNELKQFKTMDSTNKKYHKLLQNHVTNNYMLI